VTAAAAASQRSGDDSSGALWTWGCGRHGQLGHGDLADQWTPVRVRRIVRLAHRLLVPVTAVDVSEVFGADDVDVVADALRTSDVPEGEGVGSPDALPRGAPSRSTSGGSVKNVPAAHPTPAATAGWGWSSRYSGRRASSNVVPTQNAAKDKPPAPRGKLEVLEDARTGIAAIESPAQTLSQSRRRAIVTQVRHKWMSSSSGFPDCIAPCGRTIYRPLFVHFLLTPSSF
jgi:hypothetical protein